MGPGVVVGEIDQARAGVRRRRSRCSTRSSPPPGCWSPRPARCWPSSGSAPTTSPRVAATLSPGERTRAVLARFAAQGVNCLVLDEPTNHLDLPAIEQLEAALDDVRRHPAARDPRPPLARDGRAHPGGVGLRRGARAGGGLVRWSMPLRRPALRTAPRHLRGRCSAAATPGAGALPLVQRPRRSRPGRRPTPRWRGPRRGRTDRHGWRSRSTSPAGTGRRPGTGPTGSPRRSCRRSPARGRTPGRGRRGAGWRPASPSSSGAARGRRRAGGAVVAVRGRGRWRGGGCGSRGRRRRVGRRCGSQGGDRGLGLLLLLDRLGELGVDGGTLVAATARARLACAARVSRSTRCCLCNASVAARNFAYTSRRAGSRCR